MDGRVDGWMAEWHETLSFGLCVTATAHTKPIGIVQPIRRAYKSRIRWLHLTDLPHIKLSASAAGVGIGIP